VASRFDCRGKPRMRPDRGHSIWFRWLGKWLSAEIPLFFGRRN